MYTEPEAIPLFFRRYGWAFEQSARGVFRTGFQGDSAHYDIWVRVTEAWIYFSISPYLESGDKESAGLARRISDELLRLVLRSNEELNMAKFGINELGEVVLLVELPSQGFAYSHFADALTALSHYADDYHSRFDDILQQEKQEVV